MASEHITEPGAVELADVLDRWGKEESRERYLLGCSLDELHHYDYLRVNIVREQFGGGGER